MTDSARSSASDGAPASPASSSGEAPCNLALPATADDRDGVPPETYDPADYRWVPVRRRPRLDGWTEEKMRRFIETLADTGQVSLACKAVGLSRESAYKLRRAPHAAAFARAWDAARHHAGSYLEDVASERAIEGVEHDVYNEYGEVIATKRVVNDRLLMFLLRHLKPERYAADALARPAPPPEPVEAVLSALEPRLPAPPAELLDAEELDAALQLADVADGALPHFLSEQRPLKSPERIEAEARVAQERRGEAAWDKMQREGGGSLKPQEFADICRSIDPAGRAEPPRKRYR
jgi:hypothetical protein